MSMVVLERTREIGTLRALGLKRKGVLFLFAVESSLLGIIGTMWGTILTILGWLLVKIIKPTWTPPGISKRVFITIEFVPKSDSQVKKLLKSREDIFDEYTMEGFERVFESRFTIRKKVKINEAERHLYLI